MGRFVSFQFASLSIAIGLGFASPLGALTLVSPDVQAVGVGAATASAFEALLVEKLETRIDGRLVRADRTPRLCVEPRCAARRARRLGADGALLCSVSRLGREYVATLQRVDRAGRLVWSEERVARREEDLGAAAEALVAALFEADATSRPDAPSQPVEVEGVRVEPQRGWSSQGPRAGMLSAMGDSYAGAGLLTSLAYVWRYQTLSYNVEVVPALGLAWGGDPEGEDGRARDWTLLDLFVAWTPMHGDIAPYAGAGLGLHAVQLERLTTGTPVPVMRSDGATGVSLALGGGLVLFRTFDFQLSFDLRYQHFVGDLGAAGGGSGAHGLLLGFGIQLH